MATLLRQLELHHGMLQTGVILLGSLMSVVCACALNIDVVQLH